MLSIPASVLADARLFFEEAGTKGQEGTGFLVGTLDSEGHHVTRFLAPDQRAGLDGGWVEVTDKGKLELAAALRAQERCLARIHSHPADAFHSHTDDANRGLTAEGAWSIVVPYFGLGLRDGLLACGIYRMRRGKWVRAAKEDIEAEIQVVDDGPAF